MSNIRDILFELGLNFEENASLKKYNTWKLSGPAEFLVHINTVQELTRLFPRLIQEKSQYFVLGKGSNILIPDEGVKGVVIKLGKTFESIKIDANEVTAGAATSFIVFCLNVAKNGLSGMEFGAGIPGSIGGAVAMNAGAHSSSVSQVLKSITVLDGEGNVKKLLNEELNFEYRKSVIQNNDYIVLDATFELEYADKETIVGLTTKNKDYRLSTQPLTAASCGSVFKNPLPNYSGDLIQKAGLKGHKIGNAQISEKHGNFIVNLGNASSKDILSLIDLAQKTVRDLYNIELNPEVQILSKQNLGE
ncbi:UDP-N-acetylmuramate dehydrogenase [Bacillus toyonensis]|uniref:UDP-N-acetylmuramate dehydrogenase n=1 Tax=Bacillus toyonensis TaxID=155322 RepID=UPI002E1F19CA|nr:UDP-N-acetylmuramate dehydrogenase [Bacillus toyonensis]MED2737297.1 UDP-N-acetylmuramate dehydrogenase [Bacillus toyonensis]